MWEAKRKLLHILIDTFLLSSKSQSLLILLIRYSNECLFAKLLFRLWKLYCCGETELLLCKALKKGQRKSDHEQKKMSLGMGPRFKGLIGWARRQRGLFAATWLNTCNNYYNDAGWGTLKGKGGKESKSFCAIKIYIAAGKQSWSGPIKMARISTWTLHRAIYFLFIYIHLLFSAVRLHNRIYCGIILRLQGTFLYKISQKYVKFLVKTKKGNIYFSNVSFEALIYFY